uniref:Uncharacterized protein n=1 Tax=Timema cristinae TaxID=61476 RepID=A0A7R9CQ48_TIMCR|nr:unnamed protein product [Timema cristinae]
MKNKPLGRLSLEHYISKDLSNVTLSVLEGTVAVERELNNDYSEKNAPPSPSCEGGEQDGRGLGVVREKHRQVYNCFLLFHLVFLSSVISACRGEYRG